jgi:hypothetical protein
MALKLVVSDLLLTPLTLWDTSESETVLPLQVNLLYEMLGLAYPIGYRAASKLESGSSSE